MIPSSITASSFCPFMRQTSKLPVENIAPLYQKFRNFCPFLSTLPTTASFSTTSSTSGKCPFGFTSSVPKNQSSQSKCPFGFGNSSTSAKFPQTPQHRQFSTTQNKPPSKPFSAIAETRVAPKTNTILANGDVDINDASLSTPQPTNEKGLPNQDQIISEKMDQLRKEGRYRVFFDLEREKGNFPMAWKRGELGDKSKAMDDQVVSYCSNDYLGMGQHPVVTEKMINVIKESGAGAGGTRNISGTSPHHTDLEKELADLHNKESALLLTSGYVANDAAITTLGQMIPNMVIFSDSDNHASLITGIKNSKCKKFIFRHNDLEHLEALISEVGPSVPKLIVFESVYSMDGDIGHIKEICDIADRWNAMTFIDEVHAVGMYGHKGGGVAQQRDLEHRLTFISGTLAKAYGVFGGYIAGSNLMIDAIRSFASGFIFTSSVPPSVAAAGAASVRYLKSSNKERILHQEKAQRLKDLMTEAGLPIMENNSHIIPLMVRDPDLCKKASDMLMAEHHIYVQPINYPTVPRGTERLRFCPGPLHTDEMLEHLVDSCKKVFAKLNIAH